MDSFTLHIGMDSFTLHIGMDSFTLHIGMDSFTLHIGMDSFTIYTSRDTTASVIQMYIKWIWYQIDCSTERVSYPTHNESAPS